MRQLLRRNAEIAVHAGHRPSEEFLASYIELFATTDSKYEASMLREIVGILN